MTRDQSLWLGLLTGPAVWFISLGAKFALAPWVCTFGWKPAEYLISLAALGVTACAGLVAWSQWRQITSESASADTTQPTRPKAMAGAGVVLSAGFLIVLLAQSMPELILAGCE